MLSEDYIVQGKGGRSSTDKHVHFKNRAHSSTILFCSCEKKTIDQDNGTWQRNKAAEKLIKKLIGFTPELFSLSIDSPLYQRGLHESSIGGPMVYKEKTRVQLFKTLNFFMRNVDLYSFFQDWNENENVQNIF